MSPSHRRIVWIANGMAFLLLLAALLGWQVNLRWAIGVDATLREVAVGLWAVLLPAWFQLEERWAPTDPQDAAAFKRSQETGRIAWTAAGAAIFGIVLAGSPPKEAAKAGPSVETRAAP